MSILHTVTSSRKTAENPALSRAVGDDEDLIAHHRSTGSAMAQLALPTADDLAMYDSTFAAHNSGGYIDGNAARVVFLRSQLPAEVLSSIWRLSDMDTDAQYA